METRTRTRLLRRAVITAALGALVVPASAGAATKTPVITKVTPKNVSVGETLTIHGKNFRSGKAKNTVLFKRDGGKALFVKAGLSTKKKITVVIPKSLEKYMAVKGGNPTVTRFRLRMLTTKLSERFTSAKASPTIRPTDPNADDDGDGLNNAEEQGAKTNPALADTDGDGASDGFEYYSAVDFNDSSGHPTKSLNFAGKRPYPNPLDAADRDIDHDGDALTLLEEYELWRYSVTNVPSASVSRLNYSAGLKYSMADPKAASYHRQAEFQSWLDASGYATVALPHAGVVNFWDLDRSGGPLPLRSEPDSHFITSETSPYDTHGRSFASAPDGVLSDDERDEDADGLTNWIELHGPMLPTWYGSMYKDEKPYPVTYAGTSPVDDDSDGDTVRDGADDEDRDGVPNYHELSRNMADPWGHLDDEDTALDDARTGPVAARVNPYNPCLPYTDSATCPIAIPFSGAWAPFNRTEPNFFVYH